MEENQLYKINKQAELEKAFKPFVQRLTEKYNAEIRLEVHYDTLLFSGLYSNLKDNAAKIREELINFAKEHLDEEYKIISPEPAEIMSGSPTRTDTTTVIYSLQRVLKENEPV